jgi:lysozyme
MTTPNLSIRLVRHEGLKLKPYRDTAGNLTIGVGRNLDGVGVSKTEALSLLANDIAGLEAALDAAQPWWRRLDDVRQDVMAELAFNLGTTGLGAFHGTLSALEAGQYAAAADRLLASRWASQVGARANELAAILRTGVAS